jgi:hypothetical protein
MAVRKRTWNEATKTYDESIEFVGATLGRNYHYYGDGDGDYWPTVWDGEKIRDVGGDFLSADATPEVIALARKYLAKVEYAEIRAREIRAWEKQANEALEPAKGDTLTVVRGRKVPVGTKGTLIWLGEGRFGARVGFTSADGTTYWTAASNVVFDPEPDRIPGFYPADEEDVLGWAFDIALKKYPEPKVLAAA